MAVSGRRWRKMAEAEEGRLRLRKKANPARRSRKKEKGRWRASLTLRVYKEGCQPSD